MLSKALNGGKLIYNTKSLAFPADTVKVSNQNEIIMKLNGNISYIFILK